MPGSAGAVREYDRGRHVARSNSPAVRSCRAPGDGAGRASRVDAERGGEAAGAIAEALEGYLEGAPELSLGAPLWLPPKRPRALAVEVRDDSGALLRLQGALAEALAGTIDWQPERRRFKAHITVARMRAD